MPLYFSPVGNDQTFDANGDPLTGGQIETYIAGSSTPLATFTDDTGSTPQSNPIILNSLGFPTLGAIWLTGGQSYKFVFKDAMGVTLRTIDNISGVNDASVSQSEWVVSGFTPTYINATSFSVAGDQTMVLQVNRRLRTTNTSGFIYSTITNSVFAAGITTVTVVNDSGSLDAGISLIEYALLAPDGSSIPAIPVTRFTMETARVLGRLTGGAGAIEEITSAQLLNFITAAQLLAFINLIASGSAPLYACRAWVNFNGTGTPSIRASGNVSSITDNGTGDYTVNFTTALPSADYAWSLSGSNDGTQNGLSPLLETAAATPSTSAFRFRLRNTTSTLVDVAYLTATFFH